MNILKIIIRVIGVFLIIGGVSLFTIVKINPTYKKFQSLIKANQNNYEKSIIEEKDINHLPKLIQEYLRVSNVVGSEQVHHFKMEFSGEINLNGEYVPLTGTQVSFINEGVRLFYMEATYNYIPIKGLHHFEDGKAAMKIKLFDAFAVVNETGEEMNQSETVTFLNDICFFAPGALIQDNFTFTEIDESHVDVTYTLHNITVSAQLTFDEEKKLIDFISNDRYAIKNNQSINLPWSTPIQEYGHFNGLYLAKIGDARYHHEDHDDIYIKLDIQDIIMNAELD